MQCVRGPVCLQMRREEEGWRTEREEGRPDVPKKGEKASSSRSFLMCTTRYYSRTHIILTCPHLYVASTFFSNCFFKVFSHVCTTYVISHLYVLCSHPLLLHLQHPEAEPKCQNCNLIEMGSMACYEGVCPQCGRPPPK